MKHLTNAIEAKENFYSLATEHRDYPVKQMLNTYYKTFDNEMKAYFDEVADHGNEEELLEEFYAYLRDLSQMAKAL
ncbi:hypothetical protein [Streptococcus suis]|uniref:hypothetical protein n=1 Tax=Streptococcus suis TaxID=1307 RepID=UPI000C19A445|nr:hypothetical protein [Streptococcus suis]